MKRLSLRAIVFFSVLGLSCPSPPAHAGTVAGVELPDSLRAGHEVLTLNGMGVYRRKMGIRVLVVGLYLNAPEKDPAKILRADSPRRLVTHFLRNISSTRICGAWRKGLDRNTPNASEEVRTHFRTLCGWMRDCHRGDEITVTYMPEKGSTVEINGSAVGTIKGKEFADAYFGLVLGPRPIKQGLKSSLLGG